MCSFHLEEYLIAFSYSQEEVENVSNRCHLNLSYSDQLLYYDQIIIPLLDKLAPGDRWFKSQSILGKVFRKASLLEERLYKDLKARGVDSETIRKLKALWKKKNAYK